MTHQMIAFTRSMRLSVKSTEAPFSSTLGNGKTTADRAIALTVALRYFAGRDAARGKMFPGLGLQRERK